MVLNIERVGAIAILVLDNPPVNAISHAVRQALWTAAETCDADTAIEAVILMAAGRTFIAGADVSEFDKLPEPPYLPDLVARIEGALKPWFAVINGAALGGGYEVALCCRVRLATEAASVGLPEVKLGLVPGAGGTVRLMRLVQPQSAVELVTVGNPVAASKALALGLVDGLLEGDPKAAAVDYVTKALNAPLPIPLNMRSVEAISAEFWQTAHRTVSGRAKLEVAPLKALACLQQAATVDFETALAFERETFLALRGSTQATALRHVFFAERAAGRPCAYASITPRQVSSAAVIGGGTMGAGIAVALRDANLPVVLIERDNASVKKGIDTVRATYESAVKRGRISPDVAKQKVDGLIGSTDYGALANVDIVIEAVFEDLAIKQSVLKRLEAACRRDAVLATNTSYLNPNHIAVDLKSADRFMGLHFFSPANVMKLVEVVPAAATAPDVTATGLALARTLNKIPVLSGICDGFIGNRILKGMRMQAERLLLEGASPAEIDAAMRQFGYAMGPFEAQDLGGLDIAASQRRAARERGETFGIWVADRLVANGRLGQKTGGGWYDYVNGDRTPRTSTVVASYITDEANTLGIVQYQRSPEQLIDAVIGSMRLEAQKILNEGVAAHANDIDLVLIHGYGFPRWRGGLMHYANAQLT